MCVKYSEHFNNIRKIITNNMIFNTYTPSGHVVGMLDRDQRTAKIPSYQQSSSINTSAEDSPVKEVYHENITSHDITRTKISRFFNRSRKNYMWKTMQRLKQVLVVGTYLLSIVSIPSSLSAPTSRHMAERLSSHPKWINPCGFREDNGKDGSTEVPQVTAPDLLNQIIYQANIVLSKANQFKEDFTEKTFSSNSDNLHRIWKSKRYDWLPSLEKIPKEMGESITDDSHLATLTLENSLIDIYEHLQKFAVGLEQVVWDQEDEHGAFLKNFTDTEFNLRSLLCEIQMAIIELGLTQKPDINRDLMTNEFRQLDTTSRNLRDWLIYRDYMNALEYAIQAFTHIKTNL